MKLHSEKPSADEKAFYQELMALYQRYLTPDTPERLLAIAASAVGGILAMQDQRTVNGRERFQAIILTNIEAGNRAVIDQLNQTGGVAN